MEIQGLPKGGFEAEFQREMKSARKKAGRVVGPLAVKERRQALVERNRDRLGGGVRTAKRFNAARRKINKGGKISKYRKKGVQYTTKNKHGHLILLDLYPHAMGQENGVTLRPKSGRFLFLQDKRRRQQPGDKVFITKNGAVMAVKPWRKWKGEGPKPKNTDNQKPRLIGVLRRQIKIEAMKDKWRLDTIAERHLDRYTQEINRNLYE